MFRVKRKQLIERAFSCLKIAKIIGRLPQAEQRRLVFGTACKAALVVGARELVLAPDQQLERKLRVRNGNRRVDLQHTHEERRLSPGIS